MPEKDEDKLVTQGMLTKALQILDGRISQKIETKINRLEEKMDNRFREASREMDTRFDAFISKIETYGRETITIPHALDRHGKILDNHEKRIRELES